MDVPNDDSVKITRLPNGALMYRWKDSWEVRHPNGMSQGVEGTINPYEYDAMTVPAKEFEAKGSAWLAGVQDLIQYPDDMAPPTRIPASSDKNNESGCLPGLLVLLTLCGSGGWLLLARWAG